MATTAWVCFDCRVAVRRPCGYSEEVPCSFCHQPCINISYKIPIPPKEKRRLWVALFQKLTEQKQELISSSQKGKVLRRHALEKEIARLDSMPPNAGRSKSIMLLRKKLSAN